MYILYIYYIYTHTYVSWDHLYYIWHGDPYGNHGLRWRLDRWILSISSKQIQAAATADPVSRHGVLRSWPRIGNGPGSITPRCGNPGGGRYYMIRLTLGIQLSNCYLFHTSWGVILTGVNWVVFFRCSDGFVGMGCFLCCAGTSKLNIPLCKPLMCPFRSILIAHLENNSICHLGEFILRLFLMAYEPLALWISCRH